MYRNNWHHHDIWIWPLMWIVVVFVFIVLAGWIWRRRTGPWTPRVGPRRPLPRPTSSPVPRSN
jgi:hypothetical protein